MNFKQLENAKDNIIDITKPRSFTLLSMVEATSPIHGNIGITSVQLNSSTNGAASRGLAETKKPIKHGTVLPDIEAFQVPRKGGVARRLGGHGGEELDVLVGVEPADVRGPRGEWTVDFHPTVETVVDDEIVGHADSVGLHWMTLSVVIIADCWFVEVTHSPLLSIGT